MNGYNLTRNWFDFKFENPSKARAIHTDFFIYLVDQWNRLGQKKEFGLPTSYTMECLGIGSYNTYKKTLNDLVDFGFVKIIKDSKNQYNSKIIALSKIDEATDKALDKATIKALDKASDEATDSIDKQLNKYNNLNKEQIDYILEHFNSFDKNKIEAEIKKLKKDIPKKKTFTPPTIQEVKEYFKEKGYNEYAAEKAFNYYSVNNWIDSKGNEIKSWKQKMIGVWFNDENKIETEKPKKEYQPKKGFHFVIN